MKNAICVVLLACSAALPAQQPEQPAPPASERLPPLTLPPLTLGEIPRVLPNGSLKYPDGRVVGKPVVLPDPGTSCFFIRTLRPVLPEGARRSGFIQLQAQVLGMAREPDCVGGGRLQPLVPVQRLLYRKG